MVGAGIARKVDFGEGRSRFEPSSLPSPLPPDLQHMSPLVGIPELRRRALMEEIARHATSRRRRRSSDLRHLRGLPDGDQDRTIDGTTTELVFARDALRIAIATERSGLEFYTRAGLTKDARPVRVSAACRRRASIWARSKAVWRAPRQGPGGVEADVPFLQGAASSLFAERGFARRQRPAGAAHRHQVRARLAQVLQAIRRRFEDSEGKRIFLEFADEERAISISQHQRYRALVERQNPHRRRVSPSRSRGVDRLHTHTTASDGRCTPPGLVSRIRGGVRVLSVTDHDTVAAWKRLRRPVPRPASSGFGHRDYRDRRRRRTCSAISSTCMPLRFNRFSPSSGAAASTACGR